MLRTTAGQIVVNEALPPALRDYERKIDKKGMYELLGRVAKEYPEAYRDVMRKLTDVGARVSTESGGYSFGPEHLAKSKAARAIIEKAKLQLARIIDAPGMDPKKRRDLILLHAGRASAAQIPAVYQEALAAKNPLALQALAGARGSPVSVNSLLGSDWLYADAADQTIGLPVTHSYSEGLHPAEYWAATYGARKGLLATKFAVADTGFLGKQLNQINHRMIVVGDEDPREYNPSAPRGLPVSTEDPDNVGALLAHDVAGLKRNTVLTAKLLDALRREGHDRILVRSPVVGGAPDGGLYSRDVGVRERGTLPGRGEPVGVTAAQAISEPLNQGQLGAKHGGGIAGQDKVVGGFEAVNQQIQVPQQLKGGAAHATVDGRVHRVEDAPAGGKYVWIEGQRHYVGRGYAVHVKRGDEVEAGDVISEGWPNPATIVEHKGIGEGRRYFVDTFCKAMKAAGVKADRRNVEVLARGLINHVRLSEETDEHVPDDVVSYGRFEHGYQPREGHVRGNPTALRGQHLEEPVLHYSIGTKLRPSVIKELGRFGVKEVAAHPEPPPFNPEMIRGMANLAHDEDFVTRMYGSGLKSSFLDSVHRGLSSDEAGTSFVPGLARAVDFGQVGQVRTPEPGKVPEDPNVKRISPNALNLTPPKPSPVPVTSKGWHLFGLGKAAEDLKEAEAFLKAANVAAPIGGAPRMPQAPKPPMPQQQMQQMQQPPPMQPQPPPSYYQGQQHGYGDQNWGQPESPQQPVPQAQPPVDQFGTALNFANDVNMYGGMATMAPAAVVGGTGALATGTGYAARGAGAAVRGAGNAINAVGNMAGAAGAGQGLYNAGQQVSQFGQNMQTAGQTVRGATSAPAPGSALGRLSRVGRYAGKAFAPLDIAVGSYGDIKGPAGTFEGSAAESAQAQRDLFNPMAWYRRPGQTLMGGLSQLSPYNAAKGLGSNIGQGIQYLQNKADDAQNAVFGTNIRKLTGQTPSQYMTATQITNNRNDLERAIAKDAPEVQAQKRQQLEDFIFQHTDPRSRTPEQKEQVRINDENAKYDAAWQQRLQQEAGA